jgi:hypothetical protein
MSALLATDLARRIDRLSARAHAFHRFAHHPLCAAYAAEVVRFGRRTRVCKGCLYAFSGTIAGAVTGILLRPSFAWVVVIAGAGGALAAASLAWRLPKFMTRFAAAVLGGASLSGAALQCGHVALLLFFALAASAGVVLVAYRRRGPHRGPCATCPERDRAPCSGFRLIVSRERAFQRVAQRWMDAG